MDTKKSEQERIDKKAYGPEGAPATVKPKKGRDTLTTAIPQSTIGKKLKDKAEKERKASAKKNFVRPPSGVKFDFDKMKKIPMSPKKAMKESPKKAMKESPKKAMSPKKKMTDDKLKKYSKATTTRKTPPGGGEKYAEMMERTKKLRERGGNKYRTLKKEMSPKKAMSPKKNTIAKDKDPKFKKSNRRSQAEFEPMYEGADISRAQFNKMSKREQRKYVKTQTD
jgi:hypothetical protein